ncbi:MAG TPA: glutamate--tRNA ligase family protein, partial [Myxococcota bacterium]|nr:glutamate--tRNA ligase family protein [Myxococcota bacterium]
AARGLLYACACSRRQIADATGHAARGSEPAGELRYPGTCRERGLPLEAGLAWRMRLPAGAERFDDAALGLQCQTPEAQCGDLAIRDRRGHWTYQFAVVVDDLREDVSLVVRGLDLLASTARQIQLGRLLGRDVPPVFYHHGLLWKSPSRKLSKADGDSGVRALRAAGWTAEAVLGEAAHRVGLRASPRPLPAAAAADLFTGA